MAELLAVGGYLPNCLPSAKKYRLRQKVHISHQVAYNPVLDGNGERREKLVCDQVKRQ